MSDNAVSIIKKKLHYFKELEVNTTLWDMTERKTDEQLKKRRLV